MKNEVMLSPKDMADAGIESKLNTNDLVEVVAHDIYEKYLESIYDIIKRSKKISDKYLKLLDPEMNKMKKVLKDLLPANEKIEQVSAKEYEDDDDEFETDASVTCSFGKESANLYWHQTNISTISMEEKDKGTLVKRENHRVNLPTLKEKIAKVKLSIVCQTKTDEKDIKRGAIEGTVKTTVDRRFDQIISIPMTRFKDYSNEVIAFNKEVEGVLKFLPKNGLLSVERFTREARVKMNKNILSQQSPDFKKKMSELFKISL